MLWETRHGLHMDTQYDEQYEFQCILTTDAIKSIALDANFGVNLIMQ